MTIKRSTTSKTPVAKSATSTQRGAKALKKMRHPTILPPAFCGHQRLFAYSIRQSEIMCRKIKYIEQKLADARAEYAFLMCDPQTYKAQRGSSKDPLIATMYVGSEWTTVQIVGASLSAFVQARLYTIDGQIYASPALTRDEWARVLKISAEDVRASMDTHKEYWEAHTCLTYCCGFYASFRMVDFQNKVFQVEYVGGQVP